MNFKVQSVHDPHCQQLNNNNEMEIMITKQQVPTRKMPRLNQLGLFLDEFGLIQCNGRIHNVPIPEKTKFPYLVPPRNPFTRLLIEDAHAKMLHS